MVRDGFLVPGEKTQSQECHWFDADGELIADAAIAADMRIGNPARLYIVGSWINRMIQMTGLRMAKGGNVARGS